MMLQALQNVAPELERLLTRNCSTPLQIAISGIKCETLRIPMRDGVRLATDLYLPPVSPAPAVAVRTPYGRRREERGYAESLWAFACLGYVVVSQDCRGTGDSEPDSWDYYMFESEDSYDLIEWITKQKWYGGFIGSCGGSYVGQTQWCMATHSAMSTIAPAVSGLGVAVNTTNLYMLINAYARSVGKGEGKASIPYREMERLMMDETLAGGYFNEPLHVEFSEALHARYPLLRTLPLSRAKGWLWERYCEMGSEQRAAFVKQALGVRNITAADVEALSTVFGKRISHDAHALPYSNSGNLCRSIRAPPLVRTGWYDWGLNDALATWGIFRREARPEISSSARLIISPYAHNSTGYREGGDNHPELLRAPNQLNHVELLHRWYTAVRNGTTGSWPTVMYYLMGANEWATASDWPVPNAKKEAFYLGGGNALLTRPTQDSQPDTYTYDPCNPTPTIGGSIVSYVYPPGSVDVSEVQGRQDVLTYTTAPLTRDVDVVGPVCLVLYASSSAVDTDLVARLSDVFPDGRAIQLQAGALRARYRDLDREPELLEPGRIYCFEIDMWATANRFKAGHRIRLDISSADFPRFDRHTNRAGEAGDPIPALQTIYHDTERPSRLILSVLTECSIEFDDGKNPRNTGHE